MSQEVLEIVKKMDLKQIETQLALQCAPLIAGLKISNLLIISKENMSKVKYILKHTILSYFILYEGEEKTILLVYDASRLGEYLERKNVKNLLFQWGYEENHMREWMYLLKKRYKKYIEEKTNFPHEMGLFLGYPVEDVIGFIENSGKNSLYSGYWKVYQDVSEKIKLFQKFDMAKEILIHFLANGMTILDAINQKQLYQLLV
ncbi:MAG: DUF3793 family protein [Lachnospiraceae bacterium]